MILGIKPLLIVLRTFIVSSSKMLNFLLIGETQYLRKIFNSNQLKNILTFFTFYITSITYY
jgi:hypothetical protein